ncbi:MAG: ABC transporter permease [SAR324 cluster bacterium]|nr:ABC transporter permease [SAR324 cluster bacterium]
MKQREAVLSLISPAYLWLTLTILLPLSAMLYYSFLSDVPIGNREVSWTLENYGTFFEKAFYSELMLRSFKLGAEVTAFCLLLGFPCALALAKSIRGRTKEALFLLIILPFWSNALVRIFSWTMVLRGNGILEYSINWFLPGTGPLGLMFTYPAILLGLVHSYLPYMILTCYISIDAIDNQLLEAARSLGAGKLTIFFRLIVPLALPGIVAGSVLIFIPVIGSFMEPRLLGGRNGTFIGTIIEDQFTAVFNWPLGAALSFIMMGLVLLILLGFSPLVRHFK